MAEGRARRWFEDVANALLERAVPRVREWLQGQFGPGADVSGIRLEGRDVLVDDTRVPLGPRARLTIARASFRVTGEVARPLVLHALSGELRVDEGGFVAPVRFESARAVRSEAWIEGTLVVERASWPRIDGAGEQAPLDGSLDVLVTSSRWTLSRGALTAEDARITIEAEGDLDANGAKRLGRARVEVQRARAGHFADAAAAITGAALGGTLTMLANAQVDGVLTWTDARGLESDVAATTERSRARVRATVDLAETVAGKVDGAIAVADVHDTKLADVAQIDGTLAGTVRAPTLSGIARIRDVDLDFETSRAGLLLRFADAPPALAELALDLFSIETTLRVPPRATFTGEVTTKTATLGLESEGSALLAKLTLAPLEGTLRGKLAFADALAIGVFPSSVRPRPEGSMNVRATFADGALDAELTAAAVDLEVSGMTLPLREVSTRLLVDKEHVAIRSAVARLSGGELRAEARVRDGFTLSVRCASARLDELSFRGTRVSAWLNGALNATLTCEQRSDGPIVGGGELRVDAPAYPALAKLTPTLARYGISTPSPFGVAPLFARFGFGERGVRFDAIAAAVDGATVRGFVTIDWTRELAGTLDVALSERLVRNSALLGIPAMLSSTVGLVVVLGGTIDDASARVDPLKSLGVADAVQVVTSTFADLLAPFAAPAPPSDPEVDAMLDRILDRDPRSEQLIAALVDRGVDPDTFDELLERRRAARRKRP